MGICLRSSPTEDLSCFIPSCGFMNPSLDRLQEHIQKNHNNNNKVSVIAVLFHTTGNILPHNALGLQDSTESTEFDDSANFASDEESTTDGFSSFNLGPIRGRQPQLPVRPTPYERTGEVSSRSASPPIRRPSLRSLSPLQISSLHTLPVPSPLQQLAFTRPNTPSPLDNEMNIDETNPPLDEVEVLSKASITIILLPHLQTTPPTRLLVCTKCQHGILASSLISHSNAHNIKLLPADKKSIQTIMDNSSFLNDSIAVASPNPPCPPIEGILVQNGFVCNLCGYCCIAVQTMRNHFSDNHKADLGFAKANSKSAQVQALFIRRPKYFAVTSSLHGLNEKDLFAVYLQQCAPEIETLRILNPPLNLNEVPPLLKVTQWHEHLKEYTNNCDQVQKLLELMKLPTSIRGEGWMGLPLRTTIEGYMKDVRFKAHNASLGIKCLLIECPRFVASSMLELDANKLTGQHITENTGFLLETIPL